MMRIPKAEAAAIATLCVDIFKNAFHLIDYSMAPGVSGRRCLACQPVSTVPCARRPEHSSTLGHGDRLLPARDYFWS